MPVLLLYRELHAWWKKYLILNEIDEYSYKALEIRIARNLESMDAVDVLNRHVRVHDAPKYLLAYNGAESTGRLVDHWACHHRIRIRFPGLGKPSDTAFIDTFNGSPCDECLEIHWSEAISKACRLIEAWRSDYNEIQPLMTPCNILSNEYACRIMTLLDPEGAIVVRF